ncbi:hypothetical protein [Caballeronia sp. RCC_10]|uniref:hypothetical protein n=1 Tax=Caballeronia sp. RCC_10 TaxID=3239227 RepID=UPI00352406FB
MGKQTNRLPSTKRVVCDKDDVGYWVWTTKGVSGIAKSARAGPNVGLCGRSPFNPCAAAARRFAVVGDAVEFGVAVEEA